MPAVKNLAAGGGGFRRVRRLTAKGFVVRKGYTLCLFGGSGWMSESLVKKKEAGIKFAASFF
jgi:hypothetical protein